MSSLHDVGQDVAVACRQLGEMVKTPLAVCVLELAAVCVYLTTMSNAVVQLPAARPYAASFMLSKQSNEGLSRLALNWSPV